MNAPVFGPHTLHVAVGRHALTQQKEAAHVTGISASHLIAIMSIMAVMLAASGVWAADGGKNSKEYRAAKAVFQRKIKSKVVTDRVTAVNALADFPLTDAADLIFRFALADGAEDVRQACVAALTEYAEDPEVARFVLDKLTQQSRKTGLEEHAAGIIRAFAVSPHDEVRNGVVKYLDDFLGKPNCKQILLHAMLDDVGRRGEPATLPIMKTMAQARFFKTNFGYRRCIIQAAIQIKSKEAITFLIEQIPEDKGQVQYDIVTHLMKVTGQDFKDDYAKWRAWWLANGLKLSLEEKLPSPRTFNPEMGEYYGIPVCAKRVVFVLDTSGSMRGAPIEAAKQELIQVVNRLQKSVRFNIIFFNGRSHVWQREMVFATNEAKKEAIQTIQSQDLGPGTASYDALEEAFATDPEAIYFVSDGAPRGGKIEDPTTIVSTISDVNRLRRVTIHSIGIGTNDAERGILGRFMRSLAETNWGKYVEVDPYKK